MVTNFLAERKKLVYVIHGESSDFPIGQLIDGVIDIDTGKIKAWWIQTFDGLKIVLPEDISFWGKEKIIIRDESDLSTPESLPRMQKFFQKELPIIETEAFVKKEKIGKIKNFIFDTNFFSILFLCLKGNYWVSSTQTIPIKMVEKINKKGVFFSSNYAKKKEKKSRKEEKIIPEIELD